MRKWPEGHPFHSLAKFLSSHEDARVLIKHNSYAQYHDITITPETFEKYRDEIQHLHLHLSNWQESWFEIVGQTPLPKPKYEIEESVFVKESGRAGKVKAVTITAIEPIWTTRHYIGYTAGEKRPTVFKSWGYTVTLGHYHNPIPENKIISNRPTEEEGNRKDWREIFSVAKHPDI